MWKEVFESISDPVLILDREHRILEANLAVMVALHQPKDEITGRFCYEIFHCIDHPPEGCPHQKLLCSKRPETFDMEIEIFNGIYMVTVAPIFDGAGKIVKTIHIAKDITECKRAQQALQRRDAILEAVNTATERLLRMTSLDEQSILEVLEKLGMATKVSRVYIFENHTGEDGTLLTSQRYEWAADGTTPQTDNPDLQNFPWQTGGMKRWEKKLSQGRHIQGHIRDFPASEQAILSPQDIKSMVVVPIFVGKKWWGFIGFDQCRAERDWSIAETDALRMSGAIVGALIERKDTEHALRLAHQELQITFDAIHENMNVVDLEFNLIDINKTMTNRFGLPDKESVIGHKCFEVLKGRKDICPDCSVAEVYRTKLPAFRTSTPEDEKAAGDKNFEIFAYPILDEDGKLCGAVEFARDITERKKNERKLLAYQKRLRSLASRLSLAEEHQRRQIATQLHDHISQALALSMIELQTLKESATSLDTQLLDEICQRISHTIKSVQNLTFDLSPPTLYKISLEAAIAELLEDQLLRYRKIKYKFSDDQTPKPLADDVRVLLFQSVRELLINIIKHANAQMVTVAIQKDEDKIRIDVSDDGVGFDVSHIESYGHRSGGFGLFNVQERLDYVGGSFKIQSQPGRGSRFTLTAPLKTETDLLRETSDGSKNSNSR